MNLLELTNHAIEQVDKFRSPDIDEWIGHIDPILKAAGQCTIGRDDVDSIFMTRGHIVIDTSYTTRGCQQNNRMELSLDILNADDPIKAANCYRLEQEISHTQFELQACQSKTKRLEAKLVELNAEKTLFAE